jgi:hemolysin activation/secretion protein
MVKDPNQLKKFLCAKVCTPSNLSLRLRVYLAVGMACASGPGYAQQASQPAFDPAQLERRFEAQQQGVRREPRLPPARSAGGDVKDQSPSILVRRVVIEGATTIPADELAFAYKDLLGRKISNQELAGIVSAISEKYRSAGFHLSRAVIPPQDVADGILRVKVIEGGFKELVLKGEGAEKFDLRGMLAPVLAEQASRLSTLERQLLLANARPGVRIEDTAIEEIETATGQFRLILEVRTWHVFTSVGVDNLGSSSVGPWQSHGTAAFNSYLTPGDSLVFNASTTPGDLRQLRFGRIAYDLPVGIDGTRIGASGYYSEVWPGDYRRLFSDNVKTGSFEVHGSIVPLQTQSATITLTAATTFTDASEHDVFGLLYADRIRTASLTADTRVQDSLRGTNYFTLNFRQGLDILGASPRDDDYISRWDTSPKFSATTFWFTRYQTLTDAWSVKLAAAGQTSSGPVYTSQQFYLGGVAFGRGYGSAEISGDNGLAGSAELRFDQKTSYQYLSGYQLYAFVDSGVAWNSGYQMSEGLSLTSFGAGIRLFMTDGLQADIGVAAPLGYRAPDNSTRDARVLFSLSSALKLCPVRATTRCL